MNKADFPPSARRLWISALLGTSALCLLNNAFGATVNAVTAVTPVQQETTEIIRHPQFPFNQEKYSVSHEQLPRHRRN
jgi:hypothetical protein